MSRIRVMHVLNRLAVAGTEVNVIRLVNDLDRGRFQPSICSMRPPTPDAPPHVRPDVPVFVMNRNEGRDLGFVLRLADLFRQQHVDVVHSHNWPTFFHSVLAAKLAGVRATVHGEHGREVAGEGVRPSRRFAERILAAGVDQFTAVSKDIVEHIRRDWRVPSKRLTYIPNGVLLERFEKIGDPARLREELGLLPTDRPIGSVANIRQVKDFPTLVRAFALVRRQVPSARLVLVGNDPRDWFRAWLREESSALGLADGDVRLTGPRDDIPALLNLFEIYVNSSVYEGMSNTILEAMASRRPVVATAVGGNPDLVRDGETGLLVPAGDAAAMAERIARLLTKPELAERLGLAGRAIVESRHSYAAMIDANAAVYEREIDRWKYGRSWKRRVKIGIARAARGTGLIAVSRLAAGRSITILTFHRVLPSRARLRSYSQVMIASAEAFEEQMTSLKRRYRPIALDEAIGWVERRGTIPKGAVLITFDDGYADNFEFAYPVLRRLGIPATFFLATRFIDEGSLPWWDQVGFAMNAIGGRGMHDLEIDGGDWHPVVRACVEEIRRGSTSAPQAADRIIAELNRLGEEEERRHNVRALVRLAGAVGDMPAPRLMMTWDQVREMAGSGMTFGGHTVSHAFLDTVAESEAEAEIRGSLDRIEAETGVRPRAFAYPRGRAGSRLVSVLKRCGVQLAVTTERGMNRGTENALHLKRWDAGYLLLNGEFVEEFMDLRLFTPLRR